MKIALIRNQIVENIIIADLEFANVNYPEHEKLILNDDDIVGLKWIYDGQTFRHPDQE
jgi:hypothetical protein